MSDDLELMICCCSARVCRSGFHASRQRFLRRTLIVSLCSVRTYKCYYTLRPLFFECLGTTLLGSDHMTRTSLQSKIWVRNSTFSVQNETIKQVKSVTSVFCIIFFLLPFGVATSFASFPFSSSVLGVAKLRLRRMRRRSFCLLLFATLRNWNLEFCIRVRSRMVLIWPSQTTRLVFGYHLRSFLFLIVLSIFAGAIGIVAL